MKSRKLKTRVMCVSAVAIAIVVSALAAEPVATARIREDLVRKFDTNGNGTIDVEERKGFVEAVALERRADALRRAQGGGEGRQASSPFLALPPISKAMRGRFDANGNGKLEKEERVAMDADRRRVAEAEFARWDVNGDGRLDRPERERWAKARQSNP